MQGVGVAKGLGQQVQSGEDEGRVDGRQAQDPTITTIETTIEITIESTIDGGGGGGGGGTGLAVPCSRAVEISLDARQSMHRAS